MPPLQICFNKLFITLTNDLYSIYFSGRGEAIPVQAWTGPEVSSKLRLSNVKTVGTWKR